ncbi:MAG: glycoside hydrolase family 3 N-terminal domain-containing protein [Caldilineaceae bacterium]
MLQPLTPTQAQWVETTLSKLSLEESLAQLLCITLPDGSPASWLRLIEKTPIGALRTRGVSAQDYRVLLQEIQTHSPIPLLVPANMEHGASELGSYGTAFPWPIAAGAANDEALMRVRGEAVAVEARATLG